MDSKKIVIHKGIIKSIKADRMIVGIVVQAGCASCDIKESCNLSETSEKEIDIIGINKQFKVGQQVKVKMKASQGFHALFLGYVLPFVLLLLVMIIGTNVSENEALIGVISYFR